MPNELFRGFQRVDDVKVGDSVVPAIREGGHTFADLSSISGAERRYYAEKASDVQLTSPMTTAVVLGQPQKRPNFVEYFAPRDTVTKVTFKYPSWPDSNWMQRKDTKRAERARYKTSGTTPSSAELSLERYSWALVTDQRVLNNADAVLGLNAKYSGFAFRIVNKSRQYAMRDLVTAASSFDAARDVTLGGGAEWDNGGSPRADVSALVRGICNAFGCEPLDLKAYASMETHQALTVNAEFQAWSAGDAQKSAFQVSDSDVAKFFGIGDYLSENAWGKEGGVSGPMFADEFILFLPGAGVDYDTEYGAFQWLGNFGMNSGIASTPWYRNRNSSWYYPWDEESLYTALTLASGILRNTSALV